jgi:hypothetical protein
MLSTWVVAPQTERLAVRKLFPYYFSVEKCQTESERQEIFELMQSKIWIGSKGLKDLKRAFKYLIKHQNTCQNI